MLQKHSKIKLTTKKSGDSASTSSSVGKTRFAKAMSQPYTFKRPTEFYAGEAGDETLFSRTALLNDMTKAVNKGVEQTENNSGNINIYLTYNAGDDANDMVRDIARGVKRYRMAGAF